MQPVLIVEGEELKVLNVHYWGESITSVVVNLEKGIETYYNDNGITGINFEGNKTLNLNECLIWKNKNDDEINKIKKRIESYEERMVELSFEHIKHSEPFAEKISLKNEFMELENKVEALYEALIIIEGDSETDAK